MSDRPLGKLKIRKFTPTTVKTGKATTKRKEELQKAFRDQNPNLERVQKKCQGKKLSLDVTYYLNKKTDDHTSYKKDLDNLLKLLMDVIKTEMDDDKKKMGLGLVLANKDEEIFELTCRKKFVSNEEREGIDLIVREWKGNA